MKLGWRYCVCGHLVSQHYERWIPQERKSWSGVWCLGHKCGCPNFRDASTVSAARWWVEHHKDQLYPALFFGVLIVGYLVVAWAR